MAAERQSNQKLQDDPKIEKDEAGKLKQENDRLRTERNKARLESSGINCSTNKRQFELPEPKVDSVY